MPTLSIYRTTCSWSINPGWWLAWLWLSLPLAALAQPPVDSLTTKQAGVGVFGPALGIFADTLGVWGDMVLDSANVRGNGILSLRGHSVDEPTMPQRIVSQHSQIQHLHLASPGKTILFGDLRIEKSLMVETGIFDISAGELAQGDQCQTRLLKGSYLQNLLAWTVQNTESKTSLDHRERLVGQNTEGEISLLGFLTEPQITLWYNVHDYQLIEADNPAPPPKIQNI